MYPNCHQQKIYAKFNLQIYYPLQYYKEIWHYHDANTKLTKRAVDWFNSQKTFLNKNVNKKVHIFHESILNILKIFISHENVLCEERDPLWFNNEIKSLIRKKKRHLNGSEVIEIRFA